MPFRLPFPPIPIEPCPFAFPFPYHAHSHSHGIPINYSHFLPLDIVPYAKRPQTNMATVPQTAIKQREYWKQAVNASVLRWMFATC